jgi:cobalamin biosynthesis Mg chelatase CobN
MRRVGSLVGLVCLAALMPAAAHGQDPGANDPDADSPSGAIYEIPLDSARKDAAPRSSPDESAPAPAPTQEPSSIHSENGFGSSSTVPGADEPPTEDESPTAAKRDRGGHGREGRPDDSRSGDSSRGEDQAADERRIFESRTASQASAGPSSSRSFLLVALAVLVAVGLGVAARRAARGR